MGLRSARFTDTKLPWPLPGDSGAQTYIANHKGHTSFNAWSLYWGVIISAGLIRSLVIELGPITWLVY